MNKFLPGVYIWANFNNTRIFWTLKRFVKYIASQKIPMPSNTYGRIQYANGEEEKISFDYLFKRGFIERREVNIKEVEQYIDERIKSEKEYLSELTFTVTGYFPCTNTPREILIDDEIQKRQYVWKI